MSDDRIMPCGCVVCVCEDEMQCHGCGAKACEAHDRIMNPLKYPSSPHALTREQCSLCTANRPRLCDQHYKQGADELLKHVTAAIQDQQTPGGVKATYEQLLELCNQQRQSLAQQAQEIERLKKWEYCAECGCTEYKELDYGERVCTSCGQSWFEDVQYHTAVRANLSSLRQQLTAMTAERDAYKAVLQGAEYEQIDRIGTLSVEVAQRIGFAAAHRTKEIIAQLAASQARVREADRDKEQAVYALGQLEEKYLQLQATLAAREAKIQDLEDWQKIVIGSGTEQETVIRMAASEYTKTAVQCWKEHTEKIVVERDTARQDAARLREALEAVLPIAVEWCSPEEAKEMAAIEQAHRALKGA